MWQKLTAANGIQFTFCDTSGLAQQWQQQHEGSMNPQMPEVQGMKNTAHALGMLAIPRLCLEVRFLKSEGTF